MHKKVFLIWIAILFTISFVSCNLFESTDPLQTMIDDVIIMFHPDEDSGSVRSNISLPQYAENYPDAEFSWSSSHPNIISNDGFVERPQNSTWVVLTLTIQMDGQTKIKQFPLYVLSSDEGNSNETFEVTFDFNNGSSIIIVKVPKDGIVVRPEDPVKTDYQFMYWMLLDNIYDFNTPVTSNLTLIAYYEFNNQTGRKLTFFDEFDGDLLDLTKWEYQEGTGAEYGIWGWGNSEKQYYTRDNIEVSNGYLNIHAKQETGRAESHFQYTSGKIVSYETNQNFRDNQNGFRQTYGRFEARIKAPLGDGFWPAFWLMPAETNYGHGWPYNGEIDIVEMRGRKPFEISSAIHFSNVGSYFGDWNGGHHSYLHQNYALTNGLSIDQFNVYAIEWQSDKIEFMVNDIVYHTRSINDLPNYEGFAPFDQPFYIIINLAVGGHFDNFREPSSGDFPAKLEIDWVRVYEGL